jgi:hypothetical protein
MDNNTEKNGLEDVVLPAARKIEYHTSDWTFMHDGAPCHRAGIIGMSGSVTRPGIGTYGGVRSTSLYKPSMYVARTRENEHNHQMHHTSVQTVQPDK